jgi:hypothetical protein
MGKEGRVGSWVVVGVRRGMRETRVGLRRGVSGGVSVRSWTAAQSDPLGPCSKEGLLGAPTAVIAYMGLPACIWYGCFCRLVYGESSSSLVIA